MLSVSLRLAGSPQVPVCARNGQPDLGLTIPGTSHAEMSCIAEDFYVFLVVTSYRYAISNNVGCQSIYKNI